MPEQCKIDYFITCLYFQCPYGQVNVEDETKKKKFNSAFYV